MIRQSFAFWCLFMAVAVTKTATTHGHPLSRNIELVNDSGEFLAVDWVDPSDGRLIPLTSHVHPGQTISFDSFVNHTFLIHHENYNETSSCATAGGGECEASYVTVTEHNRNVAVIKRGLKVDFSDTMTQAHDELKSVAQICKQASSYSLLAGNKQMDVIMQEYADCMEQHTTKLLQQKSEEIAFESQIRLAISAQLENHTCAEPNREMTTAREMRRWSHGINVRDVHILHDRPASQIHVIENFIQPDECQAIQEAAKPKLHRGTVADGAGGSRLSDHRKAWQAGVRVPWEDEIYDNPIARVVRRVYDYTNHATGYNLTVDGQEDLMSIQYFGIGKDSQESPDQYRPHCDGDCAGLPHKTGGRVATMVMYCDVPELGGGTNFQNAGVYVKPKLGAAAFFSYMDPDKKVMETGFTTHSGCPVIEGTKRIAVHWMRIGVDNENPWDSFNTLTIKKSEEEC